ncbi:hypothetical protein [Leptothoe sp. PORK10 BA2]|uniref:hypothetical protein n=1 Tax=Leptothoe sp. PORK10 BA2 TaxID=3110254 RepID=UPI002B2046A6|nr:hypothetical protein [Leptothoe sp. PORK10 BA2]MEA5464875.1 hypothetical protein [Leptothoe sp. PORK10 BA2]
MGFGVPFANNWAYLETELTWLERMLLVTVAQQRKNLKAVNRVAKTPSDRATSDWWQGLIAVKNRAYDDVAPQASGQAGGPAGEQGPGHPVLGYQKTLDNRILLSRAKKIALGLPTMQSLLGLSLFEKKLVLMVLAPEVQVRYGKLYHYLQTGTHCMAGALPTVELALRVLCHNDAERRRARVLLTGPQSLLQRRVLHRVGGAATLLESQLQLAPEWVDYLLAEHPDPAWPLKFVMADKFVQRCRQRVLWSELVLADALKQQLQLVTAQPQSRLLLVGEQGVGKERVAIALANHLKLPLHILDLAQYSPQDWQTCLAKLTQIKYPLVLIPSAHHWLGRNAAIDRAALHNWLTHTSAHIIFTVSHSHLVRPQWRQRLTVLHIPMPDADLRLQLWHQSFPQGVKSMGKVRWAALAEALALSPQQILDIGQMTSSLAGNDPITIDHLQQVLHQQGQNWKLRQ